MSKTTKRKHVVKEVLEDYVLPNEERQVAKIVEVRGNNLHAVETASGETYLASMPGKFRKNVWVKRGDFVLVQPIAEGDRVKGEICTILYKDQIKYIKASNLWPEKFDGDKVAASGTADDCSNPTAARGSGDADGSASESDELPDEWVNPNRPAAAPRCSSSDSEDSD